jgi:MFS family permease
MPSTLDDIRSGWRYLRDNQLVLHLSVLFFISLLCAGLWTPLAPFFIRDHLGASTRVLGWQFAAFGGGAVAGSLVAPAVVRRWGRGVVLFAGLLGEGLCQTTYAVVPDAAISTVLILGWGVVVSLIVVPFYSILQTVVDERFIGRVFAAVRQSENIALALAMGAAVLLQGRMDSSSILLLGGVAYCVLALGSSFTGGGRALLATR